MRNIHCIVAYVVLHAAVLLWAREVDTVITADGSPGPYVLGRLFVVPASLRIAFADSTQDQVPPFTYIDDVNGVMFSEGIDSGRTLSVRYLTSLYGLPKTYSLYTKYAIDTADTAGKSPAEHQRRFAGLVEKENLDVSGYKSVGVSVGNQGQMNLEQALEVRITGDIAPETELSANLSDQGTSLEGDTRELGELDMVYIALNNPRYNAVVGDQYAGLPPGGILSERKKIKGISAGFAPGVISARATGAIAAGKYAVETLRGRQGLQGPYYLSGSGEPDRITPVAGTVKVSVDGRELAEGEEADYLVDYELGALRFTPLFPINDYQVIRVEYEYKTFDYQRILSAADVGVTARDSSAAVRGALWYETDNRGHPIELNLSDELRDSLAAAGDSAPPFSTAREVHPNDVASKSRLYPLYRSETDSSTGRKYWRYTAYDAANPYDNKGYYYVWFREARDGSGDYALDSIDWRGPRYRYVGDGMGTHVSTSPVPAPQRTVTGEIIARLSPRPWLVLSIDVAGEEKDKNLFSGRDDNDNTASAARSSVLVGRKTFEEPSLWAGGNHTYISRRFSREVISLYERKMRWGRENDVMRGPAAQHAWEGLAGATAIKDLSTECSYGQFIRNDSVLTHRAANASRLGVGPALLLYTGDFLRHMDEIDMKYQMHDKLSLEIDLEKFRTAVMFDDERKFNGVDTMRGCLGGGADFTVKPVNLFEGVYYSQQRMGKRWLVTAQDTGSYFSWTQRIRHSPLRGWTAAGSSSFQRRITRTDTVATTLIAASNEITSPRAGLSASQKYSVSSERASAFVQLPVFAGEGQGTYSLDTTTNELTPDQFGNYYMYEQEVFDRGSEQRVRKTALEGDWSFRPPASAPKGFLADLGWRANFGIREQLRSDEKLRAGSWAPGYYTLWAGDREIIRHANLFYRQDVEWRPRDTLCDSRVGAYVRPSYSLMRRLEERTWEWGPLAEWSRGRWHVGFEGRMLTVRRDGVGGLMGGRDTITDQYADVREQFEVRPGFYAFVKETAGRAAKDRTARPWGVYVMGQPGLRFQPREGGFAELSYTVSWVDVDGAMDWRMARGFSAGLSHTISAFADIKAGRNFSVSGNYRGEYNRPLRSDTFRTGMHVVTVEVKAYL